MFKVRVFDINGVPVQDINVTDASIRYKLNGSSDWSFQVAKSIIDQGNLTSESSIEFYDDSTFLISGEVQSIDEKISGSIITYQVKGRDRLDELYKLPAIKNSYFEDTNFLVIISRLLEDSEWRLGDISTLNSTYKDLDLSIDLRQEKKLINQISKVMKVANNTNFRYGGIVDDFYRLDIGSFDIDSRIPILNSSGITIPENSTDVYAISIDEKTTSLDIVSVSLAEGGETLDNSSNKRNINLSDAGSSDDTLYDATDVPIIETVFRREYSAVNLSEVSGGIVRGVGSTDQSYCGTDATYEYWSGSSFYPFPGELEKIEAFFLGETGSPDYSDFYWRIVEYDRDTDTIGTLIVEEQLTPTNDRVNIIIPSSTIILEHKCYGIMFGFKVRPAANIRIALGYNNSAFNNILSSSVRRFYTRDTLGATVFAADERDAGVAIHTKKTDPQRLRENTQFKEFAPEDDAAASTVAALESAGIGLYNRVKTYLLNSQGEEISYKVNVSYFPYTFNLGELISLQGTWDVERTDPVSLESVIENKDINDSFILSSVSYDFSDDKVSSKIVITNKYSPEEEDVVELHDQSKTDDQSIGNAYDPLFTPIHTECTQYLNAGQFSDTTMSDGRDGLLFSFDTVVTPTLTNSKNGYSLGYAFDVDSSTDMKVELVTELDYSSLTSPVFRIAPAFRGWLNSDYADMRLRLVWI